MLDQQVLLLMSLVHAVVGVSYFLWAGGALVVASGAFALASAAFLGLPGVFLALVTPQVLTADYLLASAIALFFLIGMIAFCAPVVGRTLRAGAGAVRPRPPPRDSILLLGSLSVVFLAGALMVTVVLGGVDVGPTHERLAFISVVLSLAYLIALIRGRRMAQMPIGVGLFVLSVAFYGYFQFNGEGRLIAGTLGICLLFLVSFVTHWRFLKPLALCSSIPVLALFGLIRGHGGGVQALLTQAEGLESVIAPLPTFARVLGRLGDSPSDFRILETYISSVLFWVPRGLWESKPYGFGFELTLLLQPKMASWGHSMAGAYLSELWVSGGWIGLVLGFALIVMGLQELDKRTLRLHLLDRPEYPVSLELIILAMLSAGMFTFVWVGSFTYFSRDIYRSVLVIVGWGVAALLLRAAAAGNQPRVAA
jgi:hypothetical protein